MNPVHKKTTVELWLVRHGQTDWNQQRRVQGHTDIPLNEEGIDQARKLAASLNGSQIAAIYTSDLVRAARTAAILAGKARLPVYQDKRLREISMGIWEGRIWQDLARDLPDEIASLELDPLDSRASGGETLAEVAARMRSFADEVAHTYNGQIVMVVSHGLSLAALFCLASGNPLTHAREMLPENCAILRVTWPPG